MTAPAPEEQHPHARAINAGPRACWSVERPAAGASAMEVAHEDPDGGLDGDVLAGIASAEPVTTVLNPGLAIRPTSVISCGGVQNNGGATVRHGWQRGDPAPLLHELQRVRARLEEPPLRIGGQIVFLQTGQIVSSTPVGTECLRLQGSPAPGCGRLSRSTPRHLQLERTRPSPPDTLVAGGYGPTCSPTLPPPPRSSIPPAVIGMTGTARRRQPSSVSLNLPGVTAMTNELPNARSGLQPRARQPGSAIATGPGCDYVAQAPELTFESPGGPGSSRGGGWADWDVGRT